MLKRIFITFLCLNLALFSPLSNALNLGAWTKTFSKSYGSTTALGFKSAGRVTSSNPAGLLYSGVSVSANPSALAKLFKKVGPTAGFTLAVGAILGGVDYVLDPDNNRVIYQFEEETDLTNYTLQAYFVGCDSTGAVTYETHLTAAAALAAPDFQECMSVNYAKRDAQHQSCRLDQFTVTLTAQASTPPNPPKRFLYADVVGKRINCDRSDDFPGIKIRAIPDLSVQELEERYLSYTDIANKLISQADSGSAQAQADTRDAADPETWDDDNYPYPKLLPLIEENTKEGECDPRKDVPNSCYRKIGSPLTAEPDGSYTTTSPDGSTTTFYPDGSVETSNPIDDTKTRTYPDGTKTRTAPDGTTITTKPDGTITNDPNPDGGTVVADPDGTSVVTSPDGSITKYFPDGSRKTISPDGTTRTTKPDGTVKIETPNGDTVTIAPDGTKITTKPDGSKETDSEFRLPKFCDWAYVVCDFIDVVTEQFEEPDLPDREDQQEEEEFEEKEVEVDFTEGCPANKEFAFGILGFNKTFTFEFKPICDGAIYLNPILQSIGALSAAYIMFGRPLK